MPRDRISHASKATRPAPLTASIPKKHSKSEAVTSNQMDPGKTHQKKKITFLRCGVMRKRIRLLSEK